MAHKARPKARMLPKRAKSSKVFETELLNLFLPRKKKIFLDGKLHNKRERKA